MFTGFADSTLFLGFWYLLASRISDDKPIITAMEEREYAASSQAFRLVLLRFEGRSYGVHNNNAKGGCILHHNEVTVSVIEMV